MYQSNEAKIKKENPSLLPGRGQGPRSASSRPRSPSRHNTHVNSTREHCSSAGTVARQQSLLPHLTPLDPSCHITRPLEYNCVDDFILGKGSSVGHAYVCLSQSAKSSKMEMVDPTISYLVSTIKYKETVI